MAYDKQTWQTGDVVTSAKLNHMEDGIASGGGGVLVIGVEVDTQTGTITLDKTWQEIYEAAFPIIKMTQESPSLVADWITLLDVEELLTTGDNYVVNVNHPSGAMQFVAASPNDYPYRALN